MTPRAQLQAAFLAMLPQGRAWNVVGTRWPEYADAIVAEFARLRAEVVTLLTTEADPRTADALLGAWERALSLPDKSAPANPSKAQRRAAILARLTGGGGSSKAALEATLTAFGATSFTWDPAPAAPFEVGLSGAGDPVGGDTWIYVRQVTVTGAIPMPALKAAIREMVHSYALVIVHH